MYQENNNTLKSAERPAVFLDRDGTLIRDMGYLADPKKIKFLPGLIPALRKLQQNGFVLIIISNQSGIGRNLISHAAANAVNKRLVDKLHNVGINIEAVYYCPHAPWDNCNCRKPSPMLLFQAARDHNISLSRSIFVGDRELDVQTGKNAGMRAILLGEYTTQSQGVVANDWKAAVKHILTCAENCD